MSALALINKKNIKKYLVDSKKYRTFVAGEMAEWSIAAVLKTVELRGSGGSNPSLSARIEAEQMTFKSSVFCFVSIPTSYLPP